MSATFDTLRLARTLRDKAHFSSEQAEGMADALSEAMQGGLATKVDLSSVQNVLTTEVQTVRTELKGDIQTVRAELREVELRLEAKIEASKSDLIKWVVGMIGFQTIVLLGAALALARAMAH